MPALAPAPPRSNRQKLDHPAVIGKDILELLSSAMYVDPLCIFREYVQNATDAIDEARAAGLYSKSVSPRIDVELDLQLRSIKIRDNGTGVPPNVFSRRLSALGASKKRGSNARGFRGVGRLAGLAYCQKLIFRAKAKGFPRVWEMHWDCVGLKARLRDHTYEGDLHTIMLEVVEFETTPSDGFPEHFFEVELRGVNRIKNDLLLNDQVVKAYLSEVAPVPFSADFSFGSAITDYLKTHGVGQTYDIFLNSGATPVVRPFTDRFPAKQQLEDRFTEIVYFEVPGIDSGLDAVGWVLHHGYYGTLPERAGIRGFRLRAGNIQIGTEDIFDAAFPEPRFNGWAVGEVHLTSKRIIPNGRRDDIEYSAHQQNLLKHLMPVAKQITRLSRSKSADRQKMRIAQDSGAEPEREQFVANLTTAQRSIIQKLPKHRRQVVVDCINLIAQAITEGPFAGRVIGAVLKHASTLH